MNIFVFQLPDLNALLTLSVLIILHVSRKNVKTLARL